MCGTTSERALRLLVKVQNVRAFGSESMLDGVQAVVKQRLSEMATKMDATLEHLRIGTIKGQILDANGSGRDPTVRRRSDLASVVMVDRSFRAIDPRPVHRVRRQPAHRDRLRLNNVTPATTDLHPGPVKSAFSRFWQQLDSDRRTGYHPGELPATEAVRRSGPLGLGERLLAAAAEYSNSAGRGRGRPGRVLVARRA
jgi:Phage major capsid protein E